MPGGDGTGPMGTGPMMGRRAGYRAEQVAGVSRGKERVGNGRMDGRCTGPVGDCLCPRCGEKIPHEPGTPCLQQKCPKCGSPMVRA